MHSVLDLFSALGLALFLYLVWHAWGCAARSVGLSRLALLGSVALLGKLFG